MQHRAKKNTHGRHRRTTAPPRHRAPAPPLAEKGRYAMAAALVAGVGVATLTTATDNAYPAPAGAAPRALPAVSPSTTPPAPTPATSPFVSPLGSASTPLLAPTSASPSAPAGAPGSAGVTGSAAGAGSFSGDGADSASLPGADSGSGSDSGAGSGFSWDSTSGMGRVASAEPVGGSTRPGSGAAGLRFVAQGRKAVEALPFVVQGRKAMPLPQWINPMPEGSVTSCFGQRWGRLHAGVDLAAPHGTPIRAAGAGMIVAAGEEQGYGNAVLIDHGDGYLTHYGHLSAITVQPGQRVAVGDQIGAEGSTGHSTGPHLHFEVHQGTYKNPIEPTSWLHDRGVDIPGCTPLKH